METQKIYECMGGPFGVIFKIFVSTLDAFENIVPTNAILNLAGPGERGFRLERRLTQQGVLGLSGLWSGHQTDK